MTNSRILSLNKWIDFYYKLENQFLTERHISDGLLSLFLEISNIDPN
jgi:hypothetical protein